jgi:hypothetical protein
VSDDSGNRRGHERHTAWFPVRLDAEELGDCMGVTKNVSRQGVLLCSAEKFVVGAPVTVELHLDPDVQAPRRVQGTIVRLTPNEEDPNGLWPYKMAVEFDDPDPVVTDRLDGGGER